MIIWQGMGGFISIAGVAVLYLLTNGMQEPQFMNYNDALFTTGLVVFALGLYFKRVAGNYEQTNFIKDVDDGKAMKNGLMDAIGFNWRRNPSVFFIRAHLWGAAIMLMGLYQIFMMPELGS